MFKWLWDWLDRLDGNVDGAVFGLGKAVTKLDKAIEANNRQALAHDDKAALLASKSRHELSISYRNKTEAERAKRIKTKVEELLK